MSSLFGKPDIRLSRCKAILRLINVHKSQLAPCVMSKNIQHGADSTAFCVFVLTLSVVISKNQST